MYHCSCGLWLLSSGLFGFGFALPNSTALQDAPHSFCVVLESSLVLTPDVSQKSPGFFNWTVELETMILILNTFIATEILLLPGSLG